MAYSTVTAITNAVIPAADINKLMENIDLLKGGTAGVAPTTTVEALKTSKADASAITNMVTASANFATDEILLGAGVDKTAKKSGQTIAMVMPIGSVIPYAGASAPTGWLLCNGQAVSRTVTYDALFAVISTTFGTGNGSTTFNVPDMRESVPVGAGTFSAVTGTTRGAQVAADVYNVGQFKDDQIQGHWHNTTVASNTVPKSQLAAGGGTFTAYSFTSGSDTKIGSYIDDTAGNGVPRVGTNTRTKQIGLNYIIKY